MMKTMYLGIDVGGTKTLVASLDEWGAIQEEVKFPTPKEYDVFLKELAATIADLSTKDFKSCGIGIPGVIDHNLGIGVAFGHLPWKNIPILHDIEAIAKCPVVCENDAKLAGLSEAMLIKQYSKVLYVTVSTGIGAAFIVDQRIDAAMRNSEGGQMLLEHHGKYQRWEDFAAGSAIVRQFGKPLSEIDDEHTLRVIARNIAIGLIDLIAILTPDVVVLGGSVGTHYAKYGGYLHEYLEKYDNPMIHLPVLKAAERPEKAVVYGCFDLAKQTYG
jgi:glucokinase